MRGCEIGPEDQPHLISSSVFVDNGGEEADYAFLVFVSNHLLVVGLFYVGTATIKSSIELNSGYELLHARKSYRSHAPSFK